jgi:hypothetical protein
VQELERVRMLVEEQWKDGPGRDLALRALDELIAEGETCADEDVESE